MKELKELKKNLPDSCEKIEPNKKNMNIWKSKKKK